MGEQQLERIAGKGTVFGEYPTVGEAVKAVKGAFPDFDVSKRGTAQIDIHSRKDYRISKKRNAAAYEILTRNLQPMGPAARVTEAGVLPETPAETWILQTQELLSKAYEARDFVERAAESFPTALPTHAIAIARLWQRAETLDTVIATHLETMNDELFEGKGEVDATRGASLRALMVGQELLMYDCTWTLSWNRNTRGIIVKFSIEPEMESLHLRVENLTVAGGQDIRYPLYEDQLSDALAKAYVLEILD